MFVCLSHTPSLFLPVAQSLSLSPLPCPPPSCPSPSQEEHGRRRGHQVEVLLGELGGHEEQVEHVEEKQLQGGGDKQPLEGPPPGRGLHGLQGATAELADPAKDHR